MAGGSCARFADLPERLAKILYECRRATLSTLGADGTIATIPVCFAITGDSVIVAVDEKPKRTKELARVRNIRRDARTTLLFDRWDEDWTRLGWIMVKGMATLQDEGDASALIQRYPQYRDEPPTGPFIVIEPQRIRWWSWE